MKLGLGTVQFGLDYGISNREGRTPPEEVKRILASAASKGIRTLDTATLYGDSECVLGEALPPDQPFRIVTKTPKFGGAQVADAGPADLETALRRSLARLGQGSVYGLLAHDADDLLKPGGERLFDRMQALKAAGLVHKVGASVYSAAQIDALLSRYTLDICQLPLNVLDQRLIRNGRLAALKAEGVEVHSRSAFLQGLLLMDPDALPDGLQAARTPLREWRRFHQAQALTPLQAALGFVLALPEVDTVVCGVNTLAHLDEICASCEPLPFDFSALALDHEEILDPSQWRLARA